MKKPKSSRRSRSIGKSEAQRAPAPPRKLVEFHPEDLRALEELAEDKSSTLQELMDKAVRDFLDRSGRPTNLRDALRKSAKSVAPEKKSKAEEKKAEENRAKKKNRVRSRT